MKVIKRDKQVVDFQPEKIRKAIESCFKQVETNHAAFEVEEIIVNQLNSWQRETVTVEEIQDLAEDVLMSLDEYEAAKEFILYRERHKNIRDYVQNKIDFISKYKEASNTANATVDDNSNVSNRNIAVINAEAHKQDNIQISRGMVMHKLKELYPDFEEKQYVKDLESHIIYKHDESTFSGAIAPYCVSISLYPFIINGIKEIGGLSAAPKNIDSFCGMYVNLLFAVASQYAGAVAVSEFLPFFIWFCKKEWGENFWKTPDKIISTETNRTKTIRSQIHQYWQQVIYSISQPASARGIQSIFYNQNYFDKPFFESMFGNFYFPDGTQPDWESLNWTQKEFMQWFNQERLRCLLTFPVESFALIYKDGKFEDEETAKFVAEEYARGHSFFTYISDTADSLSSCCFSKDQKVLWKSSTSGVHLTTLEKLHNTKWEPEKKNLKIFHNGSWVSGKSIKLQNRKMFKVVTSNNKEFIMTDNHINVTLNGEKQTSELTTNDYLMFNTIALQTIPENNEGLTYEQGFVIGAFLGDGSFGSEVKGTIYDINFSQNANKYQKMMEMIDKANIQIGGHSKSRLNEIYNNVYPVRISSKELVAFIMKWTCWKRGTYAYNKKLNLDCLLQSIEFRRGILDGWYNTDGGNSNRCYTTSKELVEDMEVLITSLGLQSIINVSDRTDEEVVIREKSYDRNYPLYCVRWYEPANHRTNKEKEHTWIKKNNSIYFKIKSIEEVEYNDDVYCIECKNEEEPYFTLPCGLITHNCRLKNKVQTKEFNFTNGNLGVETGSKSVITLNLNRIIQNYFNVDGLATREDVIQIWKEDSDNKIHDELKRYIEKILERVLKYHTAYNELLWDMYDANLLPVYKAGFIHLDKQYLTYGINGLNQSAEFLGLRCTNNEEYKQFCKFIFGVISKFCDFHNGIYFGHKITLNVEQVPAESLAVKNYNWDKSDGYYVGEDTNLYASYVFKPNDPSVSVLDKLVMHSKQFASDELSGGQAAHINLSEHLSKEQYWKLLNFAGDVGCSYFTFNIPNCECDDCGYIAKQPFTICPKCGSTHVSLWDRIIG